MHWIPLEGLPFPWLIGELAVLAANARDQRGPFDEAGDLLAVRCPWAPLQWLQQRYASLAALAYGTLPFLSCDGAHMKWPENVPSPGWPRNANCDLAGVRLTLATG